MFVLLRTRTQNQSGVTLVELLVVIVVIAIVATLALMQRGGASSQLKRQNTATQLKVAFERARFDSVKRRATGGQAQVTVTPTSFTLRTYPNGTATDETTTVPTGIVIANYDGTTLVSSVISFNMRGEVPSSPSPQFYVCNTNCTSPTDAKANIVIVTLTGTVNMLSGGSSLPTFGVPTETNVNTSTGINNDVVL